MIYVFWNDFGFVVMFSVILQHRVTIVWLQGTMFNLPIIVPIEAFKDLNTIVGDNMISVIALSHINNWLLVD
jgi:hypothetical protein